MERPAIGVSTRQNNVYARIPGPGANNNHDCATSPCRFAWAPSIFGFFASPGPPSPCCILLISVSGGREGVSGGAGRFIAGGLYAPLFDIGLCIPPGIPMRRFASAAGFTKFGRADVVPFDPPFIGPLGGPLGGAIGGAALFAAAGASMIERLIGSDLPAFTPAVRRIEGLSACGLKGCAVPSFAARPVTKPTGASGGTS